MKGVKVMGTNVTLRTFTVFLWAFLIATAAIAGEEHRTHIKVAVDGDGKIEHVLEDIQSHKAHEDCIFRKEQDATN